eukprot:COSAG06_NODE_4142_length_4531_cov_19.196977_2_plen_66_part_00
MRQGAVQDGTQGGGGAQSSISGHAPRSQDKAVPKGGETASEIDRSRQRDVADYTQVSTSYTYYYY